MARELRPLTRPRGRGLGPATRGAGLVGRMGSSKAMAEEDVQAISIYKLTPQLRSLKDASKMFRRFHLRNLSCSLHASLHARLP